MRELLRGQRYMQHRAVTVTPCKRASERVWYLNLNL